MVEVPTSTKANTVMVMRHGGTHLILPLVKQLTGQAIYRPKGDEAVICRPNGKTIVFIRNPRNRIISAYRWKHRGHVPDDAQLAAYMTATKRGWSETPLQFMARWAARWMAETTPLLVRFEDVTDPDRGLDQVRRIASFLDAKTDAATVYGNVVGKGTFTGRHSNWRECFGTLSLAAWQHAGGNELENLMGYPQ